MAQGITRFGAHSLSGSLREEIPHDHGVTLILASTAADAKETKKETKRKKEKEFAWMVGAPNSLALRRFRLVTQQEDSEEEGDEEEGNDGDKGIAGDRPKDRDREKDREKEKEKEKESADDARGTAKIDENADVSAETLDEVQSFGKMMILAPALLKKLRRMSPENVAAACRAMARTKFFDGDILRDLNDVLKRLLQRDQLSSAQVNDALQCLWEINAYDQNVLSAIASTFKGKLASLEPIYRQTWREIFEGFKHERDKDFRQLLETPPLTAASPGYQKIRCFHHSKGFCAVGDKACTYSHDPRAPLTLEMFSVPMRASPLVMTQNQYTMGRTIYGGARNGQFAA
ncbi:hypothetical protein AK812_SmicGene25037 [Symbiodinium microadriaticum]|uniref:C3H1-type domain-containing protein n=1 Tax=Symbiodinium microadriaticum TaxID=2951 RepID=A0A1Q9DD93_SYMMI|nr:hypothetical protein AK812_SmicGene25037 [Symbiodinium microadriaticum]